MPDVLRGCQLANGMNLPVVLIKQILNVGFHLREALKIKMTTCTTLHEVVPLWLLLSSNG